MEEQLITFETAKLAKEKRFDWKCNKVYTNHRGQNLRSTRYWEGIDGYVFNDSFYFGYDICTAPTQSLLQKWLREIHKLNVIVNLTHGSKSVHYYPFIYDCNVHRPKEVDLYDVNNYVKTYEEALEKGLQEALKIN